MNDLELLYNVLRDWITHLDGYSLVLGMMMGVTLSACIILIAILVEGLDTHEVKDWRPSIMMWRE